MIPQANSPSFSSNIQNHPLRLNSSSITSPSDSNLNSDAKRNLVNFEQFHHNCQPKKKLTIVIDESYGFEEDSSKVDPLAFHKSNQKFHEEASTPLSDLGLLSPVQNNQRVGSCDYGEILYRLKFAQEKNEEYEMKIKNLESQVEESHETMVNLQKNQNYLQNKLMKKEEVIESQQKYIDELIMKMNAQQQKLKQMKTVDEKIREKEGEVIKLTKVTERLKSINKDLNKQLKTNERKVRDLEGEVQKSVVNATLSSLNKMKQSTMKVHNNKENHTNNNGRKSLERKKSGTQIKKTQRIASSSSTLLTKKLIPK